MRGIEFLKYNSNQIVIGYNPTQSESDWIHILIIKFELRLSDSDFSDRVCIESGQFTEVRYSGR